MDILDFIPLIVAMAFMCGFIIWVKHRNREDLWQSNKVREGNTVIVVYSWGKMVGKKIVDIKSDEIRLQHIGWIKKKQFLDRAYVDEYGRLCMKSYV